MTEVEKILNDIATGKIGLYTGFEPLNPNDFEDITDQVMDRVFSATFDTE